MHSTMTVAQPDGGLVELPGVAVLTGPDPVNVVHPIASATDLGEPVDLEAPVTPHGELYFSRLVADVAARFSASPPETFDDTIVDCLRRTGEALQFEWAVLWRRNSGRVMAVPTHYWVPPSSWAPEPVPIASIPSMVARLEAGGACCFGTVGDLPESDREVFRRCGIRSGLMVPLPATGDDEVVAALTYGSTTRDETWSPAIVDGLRLVAGVLGQAFAHQASHAALEQALGEISRLRERAAPHRVELRREVRTPETAPSIASNSAAIRQVLGQLEQVAPTPATVLLLGETGSGKDVLAQAIHDLSPRRERPMIRVSCAAIPAELIESELFGRERGAYTGALTRQVGRFEAANQSTLFLDEIGELPMAVQVKLLRVLQERVIERLGSTQPIKIDVRIIAATNRNLEAAVLDKTFREDLFYRLNVFPLVVPPLRERVEDIPSLVWTFVDEFSRSFGRTIESIPGECLRELQRYRWPGNVRELRNVIERAVIVATGRELEVWPPLVAPQRPPQADMTLSARECYHIRAVLESTNWRVRGPGGAAERLGLKPTTLESRMARLGIMRKHAS